jgi:hypothetical protein
VQYVTRAVYMRHDGDAPSKLARTLTFTLTDGDGGTDSATASVTITPDNDAPVLVDPIQATISYTEGAAAVALMQGVTLSDADLPANFVNGGLSLTVSGAGGAINLRAGSNFVVVGQGGGLFGINYVDGNNQIGIGMITGYGTNNVQITALETEATLVRLNDLLDDFVYSNADNNIGTADRTATLTFNDGNNIGQAPFSSAETDTVTQTIDVTAVNDAPVASVGGTIGTSEDAVDAWLSGMSVSDPDADPATDKIYVTFIVTNGTIELRTDVAGGITAGDIVAEAVDTYQVYATQNQINATLAANNGLTYTPTANFNGNAKLQVYVNDNGASGIDPGLTGDETTEAGYAERTISVSAVNDAPTSANDSVTASEDDAYIFTVADFPFNDVDGHTLSGVRITDVPNGGTMRLDGAAVTDEQVISLADIQAGKLTYTPNADQVGSPYATFGFKVIDSGSPADGAATESGEYTMTINVAPDNLAPVLDLNGAEAGINNSASYTEDASYVTLASGLTLTDDGTMLTGATVRITSGMVPNGGAGSDYLSIAGSGVGVVSGITYSYSAITGILTLSGTASVADYEALLRQVAFQSTTNDPGTGRTISWEVTDGTASSAPAETTITVTQLNDGPVNSVPVPEQNATEDTDFVFSTANSNAITVSDRDAGGGDVTVTLSVAHGTLTLATDAGLTSVSGDESATVTLTGSVSEINTALNGLVYRGSLNFEGTDTLTILTSDNGLTGDGGAKTDSDEVTIKVADDGFINGDTDNNVLNGTPQRDIFLVQQGGNDTVNGLGSRDVFYFGDAFTAQDTVNGGGQSDIVILQGNYLAQTSVGSIRNLGNLGSISLFSSGNNLYGGATAGLNNYNLIATNDTVAAGQVLKINGTGLQADEDVTFDGSAELDGSFQFYGGRGTDQLTGGAMGDNFVFTSGTWDASDRITGGGGYDVLYLRGDYAFTFGATQLSGIESIGLLSATEKVFASGGDEFDYEITWNDAMLDAGQTITVNGSRLGSEESLSFNGSMESDGKFRIFGGGGNDLLQGGAGADLIYGGGRGDTLYGNGGNDVFRYQSVTESNSTERDGIQDFSPGDLIDLSRIDADTKTDGDQAFTFIGNAAFSGKAGELRFENVSLGGPIWEVEADVDGDGVSDFEVILVINPPDPITASDFIL